MFDVGGTVEDRIDMAVDMDFLRHVAIDDEEAAAEQIFIRCLKLVEQQVTQTSFCVFLFLAAYETCNGCGV